MTLQDDKEPFLLNDGQYYIYVNGQNDANTALGRLMQDFRETDPDKIHYEELRTRAKYCKINEKGEKAMSSVVDKIYKKGVAESIKNTVKYLKHKSSRASVIEQLMGTFGLSEDEALKYYDAV